VASVLAKIEEIDARGSHIVHVYSHPEKSTLRKLATRHGGSEAPEIIRVS